MNDDLCAVDRTIHALRGRLIGARAGRDHWEGRLSSSALATATAILALSTAESVGLDVDPALAPAGARWLAEHVNADGGWGDTTASRSNLSTTALVWAALSMAGSPSPDVIDRARVWIERQTGSLEPDRLRYAIVGRYGKDRTFSVPILTVLALAGKLGDGRRAWRRVPQLPFELAALPHAAFRWLRLPVVSYALPALIAMGQVRHHHAPTWNPALRGLRSGLRTRTLDRARRMQPSSGGYLEAIPLTAFVATSLIASGSARHPIVAAGLRFLADTARTDGSWPIDTNLATWLTTGSVRALAPEGGIDPASHAAIREWLLEQQVQVGHPFTHARPGGWAWTDSSGGVPDADDTSGALLALETLGRNGAVDASAAAGIRWLLDLQNSDGGIPTFCRGWGALPFDRSAPDLTAHALEAWGAWYPHLDRDLAPRVTVSARRAIVYLGRVQEADGSWLPLWFGNEQAPEEANPTYGTARVVTALSNLPDVFGPVDAILDRGRSWLLRAQDPDGGWGGAPGVPASIEETGLALEALASGNEPLDEEAKAALSRGASWLVQATGEGRTMRAAPIGLYFARLWYDEALYPIIFALRGLAGTRARAGPPR